MLYILCDKSPAESWDYTPAEIDLMIEMRNFAREQQAKIDQIKHTDLVVSMLNSAYGPYLKEGQRYPFKLEKFLPKGLIKKEEVSEKEKSKRWSSAGKEMMAVVREHERGR